MADNNSIYDHVMDALFRTGKGTQEAPYRPRTVGDVVQGAADGIDHGLHAMHEYGKQAGPLPLTTGMQINHAIGHVVSEALPITRALINQYRNPGPPAAPAPPTAPAYATDPEDRGRSMGVAPMRPGIGTYY